MSPESYRSLRPVEPIKDIPYQTEAQAIKARGKQLISPFWALSRLGDRFTSEGSKIIAEKLKAVENAQEIGFRETSRGLRFPAGNIDSLIFAMRTIFFETDTLGALTAKAKRKMDNAYRINATKSGLRTLTH